MFMALGMVASYAAGALPLAFSVAAVVYVLTGLVYAELASTYPYAGGAQVYAARGLGDAAGFVAGWALILSYTVDVALFSLAAAGYLSYFLPWLASRVELFGLGVRSVSACAALVSASLTALNLVGIRGSSRLNEAMVALGLTVQALLLIVGLASLDLESLSASISEVGSPGARPGVSYLPGIDLRTQNFLYASTLAMSSFVGVESIAQAAEEIRRPHRWIPVATKLSVASVLVFALGLSAVGVGTVGWRALAAAEERPLTALAFSLPLIGPIASPVVAATGFAINLVSANTGIIGVSRVAYSMGKYGLLPSWFRVVHRRWRTPARTVLTFGAIGSAAALVGGLDSVADVYAFGALISYLLVHLSVIKLRNMDRDAYRPWRSPGSVSISGREVPLVGAAGALATASMLALVAAMHPVGRTMGSAWIAAGLAVYASYRRAVGLPILGRLSGSAVKPASRVLDVLVPLEPRFPPEVIAEAVSLALRDRARVHLLAAVDPTSPGAASEAEELSRFLDEVASLLRDRVAGVGASLRWGDPADATLEEARRGSYDLILILAGRRPVKGSPGGIISRLTRDLPGRLEVVRWGSSS